MLETLLAFWAAHYHEQSEGVSEQSRVGISFDPSLCLRGQFALFAGRLWFTSGQG
jgi:hypothetical protein